MSKRLKRLLTGLVLMALLLLVVPASTTHSQGGSITIVPTFPTKADFIRIIISGQWGTGCPRVSASHTIVGNTIIIQGSITNAAPICTQVVTPWSIAVAIGRLPAGTYIVNVNIQGGIWSVVGTRVFTVREAQPVTPTICDPGAHSPDSVFFTDGARYYATGGANTAPGADHWFDLTTIDTTFLAKWQAWGKTSTPFGIELMENGDWAIYRGGGPTPALPPPPTTLDLCLNTPGAAPAQVEVFVQQRPPDPTSAPAQTGEIRDQAGWLKVGRVTVPGFVAQYRLYSVTVTDAPGSEFYNVAVRLVEETGEANVLIAWLKLRR